MRKLMIVAALVAAVVCGCQPKPKAQTRYLPPMPKLADRPVTATALIRGDNGKTELKRWELTGVKRPDGGIAFTVKLADLPDNAFDVRIIPSCSKAKKGEKGWWMEQRGEIGSFNQDDFTRNLHHGWIYMPYFAMKTPRDTFIAIAEGMRFEHNILIRAYGGEYFGCPVWQIADIGSAPYEDMTLVVYQLPMDNDYNEMAKVYRSYKFAHDPSVRTLKERIKTRPHLAKLAKSIALRQNHACKPFNRETDSIDFTPETEHPVRTNCKFTDTLALLRKLKDAGVDDIALCVAGWQTGGYDGRCPATFPIPTGPGGEEGLRQLIKGGQDLGYIVDGHSNYTDCFSCSPMWNNGEIACLKPDGTLFTNGAWSGGKAHNLCLKNAWETFLPKELEKIAALGFHGCHYIDVFTAVQPYRCCSPKHPANAKQQAEYQLKIVKRCHELFGGFASECSVDHLLGYVDYINYVCAPMRGKRQAEAKGRKSQIERFVPFFELAFHDVVLSNPDKITQEVLSQKDNLILVEYGGRPIFYYFNDRNMPGIIKAWEQFKTLRHLQLEEMVEHKEIFEGVVRVTYGNGDKVYVNHTSKPQSVDGVSLAAQDFKLVAAR